MISLKNLTKTGLALLLVLTFTLVASSNIFAQTPFPGSESDTESVFGTIEEPPGVDKYNAAADGGIGLINFVSVGVRIVTIVAGLYVFLNLITAGYDYISAGDSKAHQAVRDKITMSLLGLVIIVVSYTVVALVSLILFGDPSYILSPQITGPGQ